MRGNRPAKHARQRLQTLCWFLFTVLLQSTIYMLHVVAVVKGTPSEKVPRVEETIPNVVTVFSAPNYIDRAGNLAAVAVLTNQGGNLDKQSLTTKWFCNVWLFWFETFSRRFHGMRCAVCLAKVCSISTSASSRYWKWCLHERQIFGACVLRRQCRRVGHGLFEFHRLGPFHDI